MGAPAALLLVLSLLATRTAAVPRFSQFEEGLVVGRLSSPEPADRLSDLQVVDNVVQLRRENGSSLSAIVVETIRAQAAGIAPAWERLQSGATSLVAIGAGTIYMAPVTVGGQDFYTVIDTGSSDPWLAAVGFDCVNPNGFVDRPEDECNFGALYDPMQSTSFAPISNVNMNLSYADGEALTGPMGRETFTMAGLTVPNQQFGLVNYAAWYGDYVSSGLIGFAYRALTNAYVGSDPRADVRSKAIRYNPLFTNMVANGLTSPVFSMALSRDPSEGGVMALGGVPDIPRSSLMVSVPIIPLGVNYTGEIVYEYYTVSIDGYAVAPPSERLYAVFTSDQTATGTRRRRLLSPNTNVIIDSGTSLILIPDDVAATVVASFVPPGYYDEDTLTYYVSCDAVPPVFGISIGGKVFYVNPADMILRNSQTTCISGVQNNLGELTILGDLWMRNVLAVFDLGAQRMGFAARQYYTLRDYVAMDTSDLGP